ncbi:MAG: outer membrane protein transport protein [Betaproteobacteria bacterium]|nr:outer membrane protein transport protein [Betaproteobacteria bacterium]
MLCFSAPVLGAGFAIMEQSVKELGQAFSGAPTNIEDGSMVFFNPAAMSRVHGRLVSVSGYLVAPSVTFDNRASQLSPLVGGAPLRGNNGGNSASLVAIPNFYYVQTLTEKLAIGLGVNAPFGMRNRYNADWIGRYQAIESRLETINFNPAIALKVTEKISFGAGFNIQYLRAKLTNAIDFGTVCLQALGSVPCANQGLLPQTADGHVALKGDSVGLGYNFGIFFTPNQNTRLGVSYRSKIDHNVKGDADFTTPGNAIALTQNGSFIDTNIRAPVTMPDNVMFGFYHRINARWAVSADALWTRWSHIQALRTEFSSAQPDEVQDLKWEDTWRYAFGISYFSQADRWTFRTGFAYDQSPVPNSRFRSPRIPDNDRYWLTAGFTYAILENINLHGAYAHLFFTDPAINRSGTTDDRLIGEFSEQINIVGLQLDWRF